MESWRFNTTELRTIISELNKHKPLREISKTTGIHVSKLSRLIKQYLEKELISKHLIIPLEQILSNELCVVVIHGNQKSLISLPSEGHRVVVRYYSFIGSPVYIYYLEGQCSSIDNEIDTTMYRVEAYGKVVKTICPLEDPGSLDIYLLELAVSEKKRERIDENDQLIAIEIFRLFNPPLSNRYTSRGVLKHLEEILGVKSVRLHFYNHIYRYVFTRYTLRLGGDYLLIHAIVPTIEKLRELLAILLREGFIAGYIQVHVLHGIPLNVIIHAWGFYERFIDETRVHSYIKNTLYTVYPVYGVQYG